MSKAGERLIQAARAARNTCWACLDTGKVIDLLPDGKTPGPDHGKPCRCGK